VLVDPAQAVVDTASLTALQAAGKFIAGDELDDRNRQLDLFANNRRKGSRRLAQRQVEGLGEGIQF
jgi:hypothetical protein